jgi:hypothetical protein
MKDHEPYVKFSALGEIFAFSDSIVRDYLPNAEEVVK